MMRYHRVSPDCHPLPNGRKPNLRTCKEDDHHHHHHHENGRIPTFNDKPLPVRPPLNPPSTTQDHNSATTSPFLSSPESFSHHENRAPTVKPNHTSHHHEANGVDAARHSGGDVLLQWGHNKRSRGSRSDSRGSGDDSSHGRRSAKIQRRSSTSVPMDEDKQATAEVAATMPPPGGAAYSRGISLRSSSTPVRDSSAVPLNSRNVEERHHTRQEKRSPPSPPEKMMHHKAATNGSMQNPPSAAAPSSEPEPHAAAEKVSLDLLEWPRIYISLSRKEKEDDFLAMKGTKLPQRPKKRAKNVDKNLQYCFPGLWLTDLTKGRYEVREKKCVKRKRKGLKGMESMDSDSD